MHQTYDPNAPVYTYTGFQFRDFFLKEILPTVKEEIIKELKSQLEDKINPKVVYNIPGIMKLFNVKRDTAREYANTWMKSAVKKRGRKMIIDVEKAMKLYDVRQCKY